MKLGMINAVGAAAAIFAAGNSSTSIAQTVTATPDGYHGSTTDLFDVSRGTVVTNVSPYHSDVSAPPNAIGGMTDTVEAYDLVFADGSDSPQTLTFMTANPVTIGGFNILLAMDPASNGSIRGYSSVSLLGSMDGTTFTSLGTATLGFAPYMDTYGSNAITITDTFQPTTDQYFEFVGTPQKTTEQTFFTGGRLVEIDAIAGSAGAVPEPATWAMMLIGFGMVGAGLRYRRKSTTARFA